VKYSCQWTNKLEQLDCLFTNAVYFYLATTLPAYQTQVLAKVGLLKRGPHSTLFLRRHPLRKSISKLKQQCWAVDWLTNLKGPCVQRVSTMAKSYSMHHVSAK
jgi:hypothetical protein